MKKRILVAGIGNVFLGDDAFGVEVVKRLCQKPVPESVNIVDFGIRGLDLAYALMDGYETAVLVDATSRGGAPGTVYTIEPSLESLKSLESLNMPGVATAAAIDGHSMDPVRVLRLVTMLGGQFNRVLIVGCEPESLGVEGEGQGRMGLSNTVEAAVDTGVTVVLSLLAKLLIEEPRTQDIKVTVL